ncbi:unnamed protein product [Brassicogethes aeneus]|uniref:DJ-1/PfpI domain-containing protein n=1 Tax=Brassicogethes aeneus TaxID=1431903 RepID=A0A9P0FDJ1_BRAAE|nr:unnamed protein product [Brassicogethes aeneus]
MAIVNKCQTIAFKNFQILVRKRHIFSSFSAIFLRNYSCKMSKTACVFLAKGTEEMEFVITADVLRRAGINVTVAGVPDNKPILCSRDITIIPDIGVEDVKSKGPYDVLVLPGGLGGSKAFAESKTVGCLLKEQEESGGIIAAICAAPTALKAHCIGVGKTLTSYPAMKNDMEEGGMYRYKEDKVVVDGNLITSRGPGTAFDFALNIVDKLLGRESAQKTAQPMLLDY